MLLILLVVAVSASSGSEIASPAAESSLAEAVTWLENEAHRLILAGRRTMSDGTDAFPPQVGIGYEAFWLRDYAYTLEGSVDSYTPEQLRRACDVFIRGIRTDGAGVDCVKFDGTPIYKPGYGTMGANPVADGSQFTVSVVWHTYRRTKDLQYLATIVDSLVKTMNAVPRNAETGLVHISADDGWDRCPYGFTDTVRMKGDVLFCSLLYVEAAERLSGMLEALDRKPESARWKQRAGTVSASIRKLLWDSQVGLFRAATVQCREHHIWGSAFAVYLHVADADQSVAVARYFRDNYSQIVDRGQIRHLPGCVYWQSCPTPRDTYQNGAYWATPTGWFVYTLDLVDPQLADRTVIDMVDCFKRHGACEWVFGTTCRLPHYLASASLPLAGIRAMIARRNSGSDGSPVLEN